MVMLDIKNTFSQIKQVKFESRSLASSRMNWNHSCIGESEITIENDQVHIIDNLYITKHVRDYKLWKVSDKALEFWHNRRGEYEHIFTFLLPELSLSQVYICGQDTYKAAIKIENEQIIFTIWISSKIKNEEIVYVYSNSTSEKYIYHN